MLTRFILSALLSSVLSVSHSASAQLPLADTPMTGEWQSAEQIYQAYNKSTHEGMYSWTRGGQPVTFTEIHQDNTQTIYSEEAFSMTGVWTVVKGAVCYSYDNEHVSGRHCFSVFKSGNCYYHYDQYHDRDQEYLDDWSSVSYRKNVVPSCVQSMS